MSAVDTENLGVYSNNRVSSTSKNILTAGFFSLKVDSNDDLCIHNVRFHVCFTMKKNNK